jgi:hypothetical protein
MNPLAIGDTIAPEQLKSERDPKAKADRRVTIGLWSFGALGPPTCAGS